MSLKVNKDEDISKYIKISLPLTESNLGYKFNLDITDEDIYYFIGKKATQGIEAPLVGRKADGGIFKTLNFSPNKVKRLSWGKNEIIDFAKTKMMPLVPDEEEFIPRKYWCSFDELLGSNLNNESHPIWQLSHRIIKDNYIKHSDTMLIQACGNYKPYIDNALYSYGLKKYREGYFDFFICSWELTPIDFSPFFPWRYYDWSHAKETPFMTDTCINHEFRNICDFVEYFGYKKIILYAPGGNDYFYNELYRRLKNNFNNSNVEVIFIWDEETINKVKAMGIKAPAIIKGRYNNLRPGREKIEKIINYDSNKLINPKNYNYGIKNINLIKYLRGPKEQKWVDEYNKTIKKLSKSSFENYLSDEKDV